MMEEPEENRLDHSLRNKFEDFDLTPSAQVWDNIAQRIPAPSAGAARRPRPLPLPLLFTLVALLSAVGGWLLPRGSRPAETRVVTTAAPTSHQELARHPAPETTQAQTEAKAAKAQHGAAEALPTGVASVKTVVAASEQSRKASSQGNRLKTGLHSAVAATSRRNQTVYKGLKTPLVAVAPSSDKTRTEVAAQTTPDTNPADVAGPAVAKSDETPVPATLETLVVLERETLVQLPSIYTLKPGTPPAGGRTGLLVSLRAERAELQRLQRRTDSLLLALGDLPSAPPVATAPVAPADTAKPRPLARRWSLMLAATPEQNTLTLQGREGDSINALRRNHETGRAGFSAALLAEYRLTPRLSVGSGLGFSTYGADLRITNKTTDVRVTYDTTFTRTSTMFTSTNRTYSVRIVQMPQLSPVFNGNGQVIRYDTVYVPRQDTVFTTTVQRDSIHTFRKTITPLISKKETISTKLLQPNYRFFTVPVLLRYRLTTGPGRWWADVAAGAQLQFFLGGTQVMTDDGENFRTETIRPGEGPFRRLNVALTGSLALNYALTNRLSVSVAPSIRWQAMSLYKPETGLRQQPTATGMLLGMRFSL